MKIAVLGSTGMLGSMVAGYLSKNFEIGTPRLDAVNADANLAKPLFGYQWIINAIGKIPQRCKDDSQFWNLNACFPARLARTAEKLGINVIQVATDCIYDGKRGDYTEVDMASPVDIYALTKLQGEVISDNMHHIRCSLIGPETHGKSLFGRFLKQAPGATVNGYTNHIWNGVTTLHFAKICEGIILYDLPLPHIQHLVPADSVSKYVLLRMFAHYFERYDISFTSSDESFINRTLATTNNILTSKLWALAGYPEPPTIGQMVKELAEYVK